MNILTFDTTFDKTYISLSVDNTIIETITIKSDNEKYHSAYLISNIAKILKNHGLKMYEIDKVATNIGPGSFTGIRVCTTVAKIISNQLNIDGFGVPSMEILSKIDNSDKQKLVLMNARRSKFYIAIYDKNYSEVLAPKACSEKELIDYAKKEYSIICDNFVTEILNEKGIPNKNFECETFDFGRYLAEIVIKKCLNNESSKWYELNPLYIQPPPVTISSKNTH